MSSAWGVPITSMAGLLREDSCQAVHVLVPGALVAKSRKLDGALMGIDKQKLGNVVRRYTHGINK